jgi:energy-coupling factor transporter ATP-binding protein EcfA2
MILVIGGSGQGKLSYAMENWGVSSSEVANDFKNAENARIFHNFQQAVQKTLTAGENPAEQLEILLARNPNLIILCKV